MAGVEEVKVVVAHHECATLRVGDVFLKIDTEQARIDREVEVMARAPIPTPEVLWRKPPVLALAAVPGAALGVLQEPSRASSAAWVAAGAAVRTLHEAWVTRDGDAIVLTVTGDGFLRYMVRRIAGSLIEIGRGKLTPGELFTEARWTAPAKGLTLEEIRY